MDEHTGTTEELVAYTDDLLAGADPAPPPGMEGEARVVRALNRLVGPAAGPDAAFRQRLRQQLAVQWEKEHPAEVSRRGRWRMWALVAGLAAIMLVIVLGTSASSDFGTGMHGTALGAGVWVTVLALGALAGGALWWRGRRR